MGTGRLSTLRPAWRVPVSVEPAYEVAVGPGVLRDLPAVVGERRAVLVSDETVASLHGEAAAAALGSRCLDLVTVAPGEESKSLAVLERVLRRLAQAGLTRDGMVVSLGGGVVSDLAGFAAASYLRGVPWCSCPTTLLAMVDASVGGKTGVNLPEGKNLVGAFWQPLAVLADVELLATLPEPLFREGAVELFKHGLLGEARLLGALEDPDFQPGGPAQGLSEYVALSVGVKARIVQADEREAGERAFLNLGHTLAHALEALTGHAIPHGEAVGYGLRYAAELGAARGWHDFRAQADALLRWLAPRPLPELEFGQLHAFMQRDKKNRAGTQRFVLLRSEGEPVLAGDVTLDEQRSAWNALREAMT